MIVNTAYPYMKNSPQANPVVFNGNNVNYPYSISGPVELVSEGFKFGIGSPSVQFENVDLTKYTKLSLTAKNNHAYMRDGINIQIAGPDGSVTDSTRASINGQSTAVKNIDIPDAFRVKNCTIKLSLESSTSGGLLAMNLTCI